MTTACCPLLLPSANEVCEGYLFTPVCQSFCSQGVSISVHAGIHPLRGRHPQSRHPPRNRHPPGSRHSTRSRHPPTSRHPLHSACWEMWATSRQYASYWNAYLFQTFFYRLYSICGKVMFSQMSVILSTGSGWVCLGGWLGGYPIGTRVSMSRGGLGIPVGGEYVQGEGISIPEEVRTHAPDMGPTRGWVLTSLLLTPSGDHKHMYDWQADGTHPTGMPSCSLFISCPACGINVLKHFVKSLPCFLLYFYCLCMCHC